MKTLRTQIVIVGGGLAGTAAALVSRERGKEVILLDPQGGGTFLSSGAWDVADNLTRPRLSAFEDFFGLEQNVKKIIEHLPEHPYALMSKALGFSSFWSFLQQTILSFSKQLPLTYVGKPEKNRLQITAHGNLKPTAWVQKSMEEANLLQMNQAKVLVVGLKGYAEFHSAFIQEALLELQAEHPIPYLQFAGHLDLSLKGLEGKHSLSAVEIAHALDKRDVSEALALELAQYTQGKVYTHVLLPPVMGLQQTASILDTLKKRTGLKVAETLALPLSIPGLRLGRALEKLCEAKNIQRITGKACRAKVGEDRVLSLECFTPTEHYQIEGGAFVLASGKWLAGGLVHEDSSKNIRETLLNLPLRGYPPNSPLQKLTERTFASKQKALEVGIAVNSSLQPVQGKDNVVYRNLFAAGSILGGYDAAWEGSGSGVALTTGYYAGEQACEV